MNKEVGLSLIESVIVIAIAALLVASGTPSLFSLLERQRTHSAALQFTEALALARSEAVRRRQRVTLANDDGRWERGWKLFVDANNNGKPDQNEALLHQAAAIGRVTIHGNNPVERYVSYLPTGRATHPDNAFQAGSIFVCPPTASQGGYKITLSIGGRVRSETLPANAPECSR